MGEKLMKYYNYIGAEKGMGGKIQLAQKTLMPSVQAAVAADSIENINMFKKIVIEITGKPAPEF